MTGPVPRPMCCRLPCLSPIPRALLRAALVGWCIGSAALAPWRMQADPAGQELAAELRSARPAEDVDVRGTIRMRDADGRRRSLAFRYRVRLGVDAWETHYETSENGRPAERLVVRHWADRPNEYELTRLASGGSTNAPTRLRGDEAMSPFAGSDFWLADLGLEFLHWPEHRIVEEARIRMRKGRPCRVLESRNPLPGARGYTRVLAWIDRETGKPILAESFGPDGKPMKEFEIGGVTKVNGVWELKDMEMRDVRGDSRTVLEFTYTQRE